MHDFIAGQFDTLLISILLGALLCFGYDIIRCIRRIISHSYFQIALSDLFFWLLAACVTIACINRYNYGSFRFYIFIGMVVGAVVYHYTISKVFMYFADYIIGFIKKLGKKCNKVLKNVRKKIKITFKTKK
ncbi:MAG: spore cortex biosynthesis protein YabQ [Clostridium sp.]|nr:spore cortex biosynthesis protein YabQ [Clostridium sp.]MCM1399641.1 spore cortex biosynthesis protein YabQ [Clostridium sp.]MCM1460501.1 spore cortex biosynthesis protein YabQ [Bacteroides sp.]